MSRDKDVIVTKPDKGSYLEKLYSILTHAVNFSKMKENPYTTIVKLEDKNNRLADKLFKNEIIDESISKQFKSNSGSRSGITSPKSSWSGCYHEAHFVFNFCPKLSSLCVNEYSVRNSFEFVKEIIVRDDTDFVMASFDISSLFTNIPIQLTSNIILQTLFPQQNSIILNAIRFLKYLTIVLSNEQCFPV